VVKNKEQYKVNLDIHSINTRQNSNLPQILQHFENGSNILASRSLTIFLPTPKLD
jgi:DNA-binding transcriptional regulator WhiA